MGIDSNFAYDRSFIEPEMIRFSNPLRSATSKPDVFGFAGWVASLGMQQQGACRMFPQV